MEQHKDIEELVETMMQLGKLISQEMHQSSDKSTTLLQVLSLKYLSDHKECTIGDFAEHLTLSKSSATQLIERLVNGNLIDRVDDIHDRRIIRLKLTAKGKKEFEELTKKKMEKMKKILSHVPQKDIKELIRIHKELIENLQKGVEK
jgi:DNA-binding MarR family transcriptional regulator